MSTPDKPATLPNLGAGMPVAIGQIDREIKALWEQSGEVASRASLMNLAIYCEGREAMARNTALIDRITKSHACRAILIGVEPEATEPGVEAWISAHCHLTRAGAKQTCCEQITFLLRGPSGDLIPNIVFSHLDSDLPLYLWWQGEFPDPVDSQLWTWVDRLIFDSKSWRDARSQLRLLRGSLATAPDRLTLCALNWTRSLYPRQALSATFDHPDYVGHLANLHSFIITHGPGCRSTAQLLAAWLASRLGWKLTTAGKDGAEFTTGAGANVSGAWREAAGAAIGSVTLTAPGATFRNFRTEGSAFHHLEPNHPGGRHAASLFPTGRQEEDALIIEELSREARHTVYLDALGLAEALM